MNFNERNFSPEDTETLIKEVEHMNTHKQFFDSFEFETFNTSIKLDFPKELNYSEKEERYFVFLISQSQSIYKSHKLHILNTFNDLSVFQISGLVNILEKEKTTLQLLMSRDPELINPMSKDKFIVMREWEVVEKEFLAVQEINNLKNSPEFKNFNTKVVLEENKSIVFDKKYFLFLFANSLSLSANEKLDILIDKFPKFSQFQIDKLIHILEEERLKFNLLERKHPRQIQELRSVYKAEWDKIERLF
ncbi:MAG: hypothetical protein U0354_14070 [Candidatus Sericytochromatia bacterium]